LRSRRARDILDTGIWGAKARFSLSILIAGRLLKVEKSVADCLIENLRAHPDLIWGDLRQAPFKAV
jgi:hypothetical protein